MTRGVELDASSLVVEDQSKERLRQSSQRLLNAIWMTGVVLGALAIFLLRNHPAWRLALPLAIMLLYWLIGFRTQNKDPFRFADSLYFMGFLWTIFAFFSATTGRGGEVANGQLPMLFGYAVLTTGVGMFLRVAVLQGHVEPGTDKIDVVTRLTEATDRFVEVLHHGATQMEVAIDRASEAIKSGSSEYGAVLDKAASSIKSVAADFHDSQKAITEELEGLKRTLRTFGSAAVRTTQRTSERWEAASELLSGALSTLSSSAEKIQTIGPQIGALNQQLGDLSSSVLQLGDSLSYLRSATASAATSVIAESGENLRAVESAMGDIRASTETIRNGLIEVVREIRRLLESTR